MRTAPQATNIMLGPLTVERRTLLALTAWVVMSAFLLYVAAPQTAPGILVSCLVAPVIWCHADGQPLTVPGQNGDHSQTNLMAALILAFIVWMLASLAWSPNRRIGLAATVWCFVIFAVTFVVTSLAPRVASDARQRMAIGLVLAVAIATVLVLWEARTNMSLRRLTMSLLPALRSRGDGTVVENDWVLFLPPYLIKKNVAVLMMMFWPALLISVRYADTSWRKRALTAAVAFFAFTIMLADHDTSKVALALSAGLFMIAQLDARLAQRTAIASWLLASLAVVPISIAAYSAELHKASFIQYSGRHRIFIWGQTAENVLKAPVLGLGLAATRYLDEQQPPSAATQPGVEFPPGTNVHSHNVFLQTWHELGFVGAVLLALAGLPIISWIKRRHQADQPYLFAAFATVATMASLSWSLIAAWFAAAFGITFILAQFAALVAEGTRSKAVTPPADRDGGIPSA